MRYERKFIELDEPDEICDDGELVEERILKQAETISITTNFKEKFEESLRKADRNKGVGEILADLEVEFIESRGCSDVVESFRTSSASAAVASSVNKGKSLASAQSTWPSCTLL